MKLDCRWTGKMNFEGDNGVHKVAMDAKSPIGEGKAMSPKELALLGVCGCTAMDVAALMRKYKQEMKDFNVHAEADVTSGHPAVFQKINLRFEVSGNVEAAKLIEAVNLSQTKYCGVSAMMSKAAPIFYDVILNGEKIASGQANF